MKYNKHFFVIVTIFMITISCKDVPTKSNLKEDTASYDFDLLLNCGYFSYNDDFFVTADNGCIYKQDESNNYGNITIYLVSKTPKEIPLNKIEEYENHVNNIGISDLKKEFDVYIYLIPKDYLTETAEGYYQNKEYIKYLYTYNESSKKWNLLQKNNITDEQKSIKIVSSFIAEKVKERKKKIKSDSLILQKKWVDKLGENIFEVRKKINYDAIDGENIFKLSVYLQNSLGLVSIKDSIFDCPVDTDLNFILKSFELTDIDNNGFKEVSFAYNKYCRGDISGDDLILFCIENNNKWAVFGYRTNDALKESPNYNGLGKIDKEDIPQKFKQPILKKWYKFSNENKIYIESEINLLYLNVLKSKNELVNDWEGIYRFDYGGTHMGEEFEGNATFKISERLSKVSFTNDEETLEVINVAKDTLKLQNSEGDIYKIYKDEQGNFNVSGHTIYMLSPPNESYLLTKEK